MPPHPSSSDYDTTGSSSPTSNGNPAYHSGAPYESEKWHSEYWDRDYHKQFGFNNTRVQRKFFFFNGKYKLKEVNGRKR